MNEFIDIYCERTDPGFWNEPLNALTNAAFLIAALCAWLLARRERALSGDIALLLLILTAIGFGSFAFHTLATGAAEMADMLPILLFQIVFIYGYGRRVMALSRMKAAGLLALFFLLTGLFGLLPQGWLNGSLSYMPALLFLLGLGWYHRRQGKEAPLSLLAAGSVFLVSLTFRSADMALCATLPFGVHFIWHMLNAIVLYLALCSYILNVRGKA